MEHVSQRLKNDKEVVLASCRNNGKALLYASEELRKDKEVVLAAVGSNPISLKYALGSLNQDPDCLVRAKFWGKNGRQNLDQAVSESKKKIVLSTKFSLGSDSSPNASKVTILLRQHPYIRNNNFDIYSPNAVSKHTCDPQWTRMEWPCRGTHETCRKECQLQSGVPQPMSCWRYSFRYQLQKAKESNGMMIQIVDYQPTEGMSPIPQHQLGDGQQIETVMAKDVGVKVIRFYCDENMFTSGEEAKSVQKLVKAMRDWYKKKSKESIDIEGAPQADMSVAEVGGLRFGTCTCEYCNPSTAIRE